jgi:6-phosphofructokinase 1
VLTSGGDAPGMNAAVRAAVRVALQQGVEAVGVRYGYRGLLAGDFQALDARSVGGVINRGGTMLGTARAPAAASEAGCDQALSSLEAAGISGLVVIGGDGSQRGALALHRRGYPVVGVASTIDNDLAVVDTTLGVDTALNTAVEAVDRLRDTASSHHRAFVVEVMGRQSGYLAVMTGIASGAEWIVAPELPAGAEQAAAALRAAYAVGKSHFIAVVAEGSPVRAAELALQLEEASGGLFQVRLTVLGHVQRGGVPTAFDRLLGTRSAAAATEALLAGETGRLAGLVNGEISLVPIEEAVQPTSKVTPELLAMADVLAR